MAISEEEVRSICRALLGTEPDAISFPGGTSRESVRITIAGRGLIFTRRKNIQRARLESGVLRVLNRRNAPVPRLIAYKDNYLIQQDLGSTRLTHALVSSDEQQAQALLQSALGSLQTIHQIGRESKELQSTVSLGSKQQWLHAFVRAADRLGTQIERPAPTLRYEGLASLLRVESPSFIKWDARPGNAIVRSKASVFWIDWEHCGRRHPLDDVAWLLCDEYTPHIESMEDDMLAGICDSFGDGLTAEHAQEYLHVYGALHSCIRLAMVLRYYKKSGWRDFDQCLQLDTPGVVRELAVRLANRASRWAGKSELSVSLSPWLEDIATSL